LCTQRTAGEDDMKKKGAALLTVVIITSVLFVVTVTLLDRSIRTYRDTMDIINGKKAYYTAESLVYDAVGYANTVDLDLDADGSSPRSLLSVSNFKSIIPDSDITIRTLDISKVQQSTTNPIMRKIYNINSEVSYNGMAYVVKMQVETILLNGNYTTYSILNKKTYKYKP
jgi:hypothetical protein